MMTHRSPTTRRRRTLGHGRKLKRINKQAKRARTICTMAKEIVDLLPRSAHWTKEWPTHYELDPLVCTARLVGITWTRHRVYERWTTDNGERWDHSCRPFMDRTLPEGLFWRLSGLTVTADQVFEEWKVDHGHIAV